METKSGNGNLSVAELAFLDETRQELKECRDNLLEYRSHLARHKAEAEYDEAEFSAMPLNTARVVSDYKMKILSCYFRQNQKKWFGKRGTAALGFMIVCHANDEGMLEERD